MKSFFFVCSIILVLSFSCSNSNVFQLKNQDYYTQKNFGTFIENGLNLSQEISYNNPSFIDEEFIHTLTINIKAALTLKMRNNKTLSL